MPPRQRFAVFGLYNSGSTTLAGMLHRLGANLGAPFWTDSEDGSPGNYYEPYDLSWHLRGWWNEPAIAENSSAADRTEFLRRWLALQECVGPAPVGIKHPLLSLSVDEVVAAWGPQTRLLWAHRPLDASIAGLVRRQWYPGHEEGNQRLLWEALHRFEAEGLPLVRIGWDELRADPLATARRLATLVGLQPDEAQLQSAAAFVRA